MAINWQEIIGKLNKSPVGQSYLTTMGVNQNPEALDSPDEYQSVQEILEQVGAGNMKATDANIILADGNHRMSPEQEKALNDLLAQESATTAYERDKEFAQNSLLWDASQLGSLGLGSQGVLQTGGTTGSAEAAKVDMSNNAQARYERNVETARTMISLAGSLASAGIHGAAWMAARDTAKEATLGAANIRADMWNKVDLRKYRMTKEERFVPSKGYKRTCYW